MTISKNLARIRKALHMNQDEFGAMAGVKRVAVSEWERGNSTPRPKVLATISRYTGVSAEDIADKEFDIDELKQIIYDHKNQTETPNEPVTVKTNDNVEEPVDVICECKDEEIDLDANPPHHNSLFVNMLTDVASRLSMPDLQMLLMLATRLAEKDE